MSLVKCPGAERIRMSFPDEVGCACGGKVEMWPDDFEVRCPNCGQTVERAVPPACIDWCAAARDCVGDELYEKYMRAREKRVAVGLRERLIEAMRTHFGDDERRIRHAERVSRFAGEILEGEGGHAGVVTAASILHDIGIPEAERKHGSAAAEFQEREGPPVARKILEGIGVDKKVVEEVCDIIGRHHSPGENESTNYKAVYDADVIVNFMEKSEIMGEKVAAGTVLAALLSPTGRALAARLFGRRAE